jgi:Protein of unknown function (DUF1207)
MMRSILSFLFCAGAAVASEPVAESQCSQEPGLAYEYYDYACPAVCSCPSRFENDGQYGRECGLRGIWLPEAPVLFEPLAAAPREISYSLAWRMFDRALSFESHPEVIEDDVTGNNIVAVSFGDQFSIYRFFNVWPWGGEMQFDLQGALWAVFAPSHECAPLINADYYVGIPITYEVGCWSFRLRGYHISCHIGDEFLMLKPDFDRRNPSSEFLDFFASYLLKGQIRLYAGAGVAVTQDSTFQCGRFFVEGGTEIRPSSLRYYNAKNRLYGVPLFAMHFVYRDKLDKHVDCNYILGYEWGKCSGWQHKTRIFVEYHDGYSLEGQFCMTPTRYLSLKMTYGY